MFLVDVSQEIYFNLEGFVAFRIDRNSFDCWLVIVCGWSWQMDGGFIGINGDFFSVELTSFVEDFFLFFERERSLLHVGG